VEGIRFVTDDKGRKVAVQIDLSKYGELWEDIYDSLLAHERANEPREGIDSVRNRLREQGKLYG
jgi:PHD/YefM family antitoxin component YafN of YafNO toxin-antitoxin module